MPFYKTPGGGTMHAAFPIEGKPEASEIDRAIAAERERCAKIADEYLHCEENWSQEIAEEIRKGE